MTFSRISLSFFLIIVLLVGCEPEPTSIGEDLLPPGDFLSLVSVNSFTENWEVTASNYGFDSLTFGRSQFLLLGRNQDAESSILIKFFMELPDSILTQLERDSIEVVSAKIEFTPFYNLGDENASYDFTVHKINEYWQYYGFNVDSLNNLDYDETDIAVSKEITDSIVTIQLDQNVVYNWLRSRVDTNSFYYDNEGVLIKPAAGMTDKVVGYLSSNGSYYGAVPAYSIVVKKPGGFQDTLKKSFIRDDVHVIDGQLPDVPDGKMRLYSGLGGRSRLSFDFSSLPSKVIINKASMQLFIDSVLTLQGTPAMDSIEISLISDTTDETVYTGIPPVYLHRSSKYYSGEVHSLVQKIVNGYDFQGFRLRGTDESRSLNQVLLYGPSETDSLKKPMISIIYSSYD
ncbi:MAG: hypothetical protein GXO87_14015 [Chlorobi bacterium]|nr:hypothetical protein [Chlorobiota bacterium]